MYPGNEFGFDLLKSLINKAYWPIYGEIFIMSEINWETNCTEGTENCPTKSGSYYSFVFLIIYMIIANVLLLNILIAIFR